jgi:outer membrane protein OmpA-like peptidoglycan-associated protein
MAAKKKNNDSIFWTSYSDLMTSLFFVMMATYGITYFLLSKQKKVAEEQIKRIQAMEESVQELAKKRQFKYEEEYKRFILKESVEFDRGSSNIGYRYHTILVQIGEEINALVKKGREKNTDVRYLIIVEGMSSKDNYRNNYELSYARAKSLYDLWVNKGNLYFDPDYTEVLLCGSGTGGVGRSNIEEENQRFLIQIIPKFSLADIKKQINSKPTSK